MGQYINRKTVIDSETGEIMKENNWVGYDGFNDKGYKYRRNSVHIKYFFDSLPNNLSESSWTLLLMIAELVNEDNVLVYRIKRKSKFSPIVWRPYDKEEIRERVRYRYGKNKFDNCWKELTKHCLKKIEYYECVAWALNPAVVNKCRQIPLWLYQEFKQYLDPYLTATTIKKMKNKIDNLY